MPFAVLAVAAVPGAAAAQGSQSGCRAPDVVGVSLASARAALGASGCQVLVRELPGHGEFVAPNTPQGRQIVARQSPRAGASTELVTIWLQPLCSQPAQPGPAQARAVTSGPTELISGLFLLGGPARTSTQCRTGNPLAGTITVRRLAGGRAIASRAVREGRFAVFPLSPGRYEVQGSFADARQSGAPIETVPEPVTITAQRTTRLNLIGQIH